MANMTVYEYLKDEISKEKFAMPCDLELIAKRTNNNVNAVYRALSKLKLMDVIEIVEYNGETTIKWLGGNDK
jgi:hypothetical protein